MANFSQTLKAFASLGLRRRSHGLLGNFLLQGRRSMSSLSSACDPTVFAADKLSSSTPWLTLPSVIHKATGEKIDRFYSPIYHQVFELNRKKSLKNVPNEASCMWTARGLLCYIDPNDCSLYLSNPFHNPDAFLENWGATQLPSIKTLPSILGVVRKPGTESIDNFIISKNCDTSSKEYCLYSPNLLISAIINHFAVSMNPYTTGRGHDILMATLGGDISQLAFCRPWRDKSWTPLIGLSRCYPGQVVYSLKDKLFYSLWVDMSNNIVIEAWNIPEEPSKSPVRAGKFMFDEHHYHKFESQPLERNLRTCGGLFRYLVVDESSGDMMLVNKYETTVVNEYEGPYDLKFRRCGTFDTFRFDAYKINMSERKLEYIESLGNRSLFLGSNQSFCLSSSQFPGLKPNSIYFTDFNRLADTHDCGIYNFEEKRTEQCYPITDVLSYPYSNDLSRKNVQELDGVGGRSLQRLVWVAPNGSC